MTTRSRILALFGPLLLAGFAACGAARPAVADGWRPAIGIPAPPFGISEQAGAATHYVDNMHPAATDTSNPYGSLTKPRLTVPTSLPAGAIVEVHGGPYTVSTTWTGQGTSAAPVFVKGVGAPVFLGGKLYISGAYFIVEGLVFDGTPVRTTAANHVAFRSNEIRNFSPGRNSSALVLAGTDLVAYSNHIHHNGDPASATEIDIHGIQVGSGALRVWVLDNHVHHNGGDSIQVNSGTTEPWARYVYVGRNDFHEDRENAVDIKQSRDVIVSENRAYGYKPVSSDDGTAMVVHYQPERVWFLNNDISGSANGIRSSGAAGFYVLGNLIHAVHHLPGISYDPSSAYAAGTAVKSWSTAEMDAIGNTIFDVDAGISFPTGSKAEIVNNIIGGLAQPSHHVAVLSSTAASASVLTDNLFEGAVRIKWGGSTVYDLEGFKAAFPGKGQGCLNADPAFEDRAAGNLRLQRISPAVDAGTAHSVYATFQQLYGLDIAKDLDGVARPLGSAFDMGAYEFTGSGLSDLSISDVRLAEGSSGTTTAAVFEVSLFPLSDLPVTVEYATADGTAAAGSDYVATSATLTIPAGATSAMIFVLVTGDTMPEEDETFWLELRYPRNAWLADGEGKGAITNDDWATHRRGRRNRLRASR